MRFIEKIKHADLSTKLAVVGILLALVFGVYTIFHRDKPNISYELINEIDVLDINKPVKDLTILFQEKDIYKEDFNLRIFTLMIKNDGDIEILHSRYDRNDIWGIGIKDGRIITAKLIDDNDDTGYIKTHVKPQLTENGVIKIQQIAFDKDKYFTLEILVLHENTKSPELYPIGKIGGIEKIYVKSTSKEKYVFLQKLLYGNTWIHIARLFFYIILLSVSISLWRIILKLIKMLIMNIKDILKGGW